MVNLKKTLTNLSRYSLIGRDDELLSVDAIQEPSEHLFGAKAGPDRDFLTRVFVMDAELDGAIKEIIAKEKPQPEGYPVPGLAAILLKKESHKLEEVDLGHARIKAIITSMGMPPHVMEKLLANLQHHNPGSISASQAAFHVLSALLASIARIGAEHQLFQEPLFLANFPEPLHSDLPIVGQRGEEEDNGGGGVEETKDGEAQGQDREVVQAATTGGAQDAEDEESVTFAGLRPVPRGAALAPPLYDQARATGGATAIRPAPFAQVWLAHY